MELVILKILIAIYSMLVVLLIVGGVKMYNRRKSDEFTEYQRGRLNRVKGTPRYQKLIDWYRGLNADDTVGKVLDLKGNVKHPGFKLISGSKNRRKNEK